jgi:hypothetical protein
VLFWSLVTPYENWREEFNPRGPALSTDRGTIWPGHFRRNGGFRAISTEQFEVIVAAPPEPVSGSACLFYDATKVNVGPEA